MNGTSSLSIFRILSYHVNKCLAVSLREYLDSVNGVRKIG